MELDKKKNIKNARSFLNILLQTRSKPSTLRLSTVENRPRTVNITHI